MCGKYLLYCGRPGTEVCVLGICCIVVDQVLRCVW